jgi:tetratricopeptide (TPR) repeat protein
MPRSAVKTGLYQQRNRASTHRRDRGEESLPSPIPDEQLQQWLRQHVVLLSVQELAALDRKRFLQETGYLDVPPGERLRQLAIHVEGRARVSSVQPGGWAALRSIYEHALRFQEPDTWRVYHSLALSALRLLRQGGLDADLGERVSSECLAAGCRAVELAPNEAMTYSVLGQGYYEVGRLGEALRAFEAGVAADPTYGWPALYRAHTLRDLERWQEAIQAYDAVPLDFFQRGEAFRVDLLKEMRAWCRLQAGDRVGALAEFLPLLTRYEQQPGLAQNALGQGHFLVRAAAGPLREELYLRTLALVRQLQFECCLRELESGH